MGLEELESVISVRNGTASGFNSKDATMVNYTTPDGEKITVQKAIRDIKQNIADLGTQKELLLNVASIPTSETIYPINYKDYKWVVLCGTWNDGKGLTSIVRMIPTFLFAEVLMTAFNMYLNEISSSSNSPLLQIKPKTNTSVSIYSNNTNVGIKIYGMK